MFKCSECGAEYETKPDYCECGNDSFEEIKQEPTPIKEPIPKKIEKKVELETKKETLQVNNIQGFRQQTTKTEIKKNINPISLVIFLLCIILSFIVVFFVGNPKEETATENGKKEEITPKNLDIPALSSFWNNSTVGIVSDNAKKEEPKTQPVSEPKPQEQPKVIIQPQIIYVHDAPAAQKTPQKTTPKTTTTQTKKTTTTPTKTTTTTSKPATTSKTNTTQNTTKPTTQNTTNKPQSTYNPFEGLISKGQSSSTTTNSTTKPQTTTQTNTNKPTTATTSNSTANQNTSKPTTQAPKPTTTTTTPTQQTVTLPKIDPAAAKVELANYKISLRNTIGRKIDFARVVGDGDCAITFKINSSGKLTNRAFAKQSSNITLNDAVYAAMMATPSFSAPPSAYNNETLRLTVKFQNGNFEINLN